MLLSTLAWRAENRPWELENEASRTDKTCSDERIIGYDLKGRFVVYSSFANTYKRTPKDVQVWGGMGRVIQDVQVSGGAA